MFEVLKVFYPTHYNFAALAILMVLLLVFFLTKKNFKGSIIVLIVFVAFNVVLYNKTAHKAWTVEAATVKNEWGGESKGDPMTFSALKHWEDKAGIIVEGGDTVHHWCWVETTWAKFASMDLVSAIWGDNKSKKMVQASESHAGAAE